MTSETNEKLNFEMNSNSTLDNIPKIKPDTPWEKFDNWFWHGEHVIYN
jgi:hypothetical protein